MALEHVRTLVDTMSEVAMSIPVGSLLIKDVDWMTLTHENVLGIETFIVCGFDVQSSPAKNVILNVLRTSMSPRNTAFWSDDVVLKDDVLWLSDFMIMTNSGDFDIEPVLHDDWTIVYPFKDKNDA